MRLCTNKVYNLLFLHFIWILNLNILYKNGCEMHETRDFIDKICYIILSCRVSLPEKFFSVMLYEQRNI